MRQIRRKTMATIIAFLLSVQPIVASTLWPDGAILALMQAYAEGETSPEPVWGEDAQPPYRPDYSDNLQQEQSVGAEPERVPETPPEVFEPGSDSDATGAAPEPAPEPMPDLLATDSDPELSGDANEPTPEPESIPESTPEPMPEPTAPTAEPNGSERISTDTDASEETLLISDPDIPLSYGEEMLDVTEGEPEEMLPGQVTLCSQSLLSATPGAQATLALAVGYARDGEECFSNAGTSGEVLPYEQSRDTHEYTQALAAIVRRMDLVLDVDRDFSNPFEETQLPARQPLIAHGENQGYAVFHNLRVRDDAEPGDYRLRVTAIWDDDSSEHSQSTSMVVEVRITPATSAAPIMPITTETLEAPDTPIPTDEGTLSHVTPDIQFETVAMSSEPQWVSRADEQWKISVRDTRANRSGWSFSVRLLSPMTTQDGSILEGSHLVYIAEDGGIHELSQSGVMLARIEPGDIREEVNIEWDRDHGILLYLEPWVGEPDTSFSACFQWILEELP